MAALQKWKGQNRTLSDQQPKNHGKEIGDIVRDALHSGDLERLKDLGPAVQEAVKDIPGVKRETRSGTHVPTARKNGGLNPGTPGHPYDKPQQRQPWQGAGPVRAAGQGMPGGVVRIVFGILGMVTFGLCVPVFAALGLALPAIGGVFAPLSVASGVAFAASGLLLGSGLSANKLKTRVQRYNALLAKKQVVTFDELAAEVGRTPEQIKKDIKKAIDKGLLREVRTDAGETCVIRGAEAWQQYQDSLKSQEQKALEEAERQKRLSDPTTANIERFKSEGIETIRKIRNANDAIPGEEISEKLSRLEATTARIFSYVEAHPEKLPETRKFLDYYLPTSLKLVEKYREYEEMDYQPANVQKAKENIESSLDTIDAAFNNLLESLYSHDTLDVETDIEVLQQMMEQEGLTGKKFDIDPGDKPPPIYQ